jgi:hypothetical protein
MMDGSLYGNFSPSRGLRQGDPLSSFLFILGSEALFKIIFKEENLGNLHGIRIARRSPVVSHLLFADDLIIFSKANISKVRVIQDCLSTYSRWSV